MDNNCSLVFNSTIWPLLQDCWVYRLELYTYLGWGGPSWENGTILPKGILHTQGWFLTLYVCVVVWCCSCSCCLPSWWSLSLLWLFFVICGGLPTAWLSGFFLVLWPPHSAPKNEKNIAVPSSLGTNTKILNFKHSKHWMSKHRTFWTSHFDPKWNFEHHKKLNSSRTSNCMFQD